MFTFKKFLLAGSAVAALVATQGGAQAGGFALREQSAVGLGNAFAGAAAGGSGLGSMFWNPATMTNFAGIQSSLSLFAIMPVSKITPTSGTSSALTALTTAGDSGDMAQDAALPASYFSYQLNDQVWLGLSMNTPYGLVTQNPYNWYGQAFGRTSKVKSIEVTPTLAYAINDRISVGAGLRVINFGVRLTSANATGSTGPVPNSFVANATNGELKGDDTVVGFTLGATYKVLPGTEVGIGYRSQIKPKLEGTFVAPGGNSTISPALPAGNYDISSNVVLPEQVNIGLRQQITSDLTLLAGFEWTNWSKFGTFPVYVTSGASAGALATNLAFNYKDGWYTSLGAEYAWNKDWTVRAGLGFEHSPIDNSNRSVRLPDSDRTWASMGGSYKLDDRISFDASYAHLFAKNGTIASTITGTSITFTGNTKGRVDIFAVGLNFKLGAEPKKVANKALITK